MRYVVQAFFFFMYRILQILLTSMYNKQRQFELRDIMLTFIYKFMNLIIFLNIVL